MSSTVAHPLPALYIPKRPPSDPFKDTFESGNMQDISITPQKTVGGSIITDTSSSPTNRSHFSPDTPRPDIEKGQRGLHLHTSLSKRIRRSIRIPRTNGSQSNKFDSGQQPKKKLNWILGGLLAILLLLLIGNMIYLDIRLMSFSSNSSAPQPQKASLDATQQPSSLKPSSTPSDSTSLSSTGDILSTNQQGISGLALNCITKFPDEAATNAPLFCKECMPVLSTVPTNAFLPVTSQADALKKAQIFCQDTTF